MLSSSIQRTLELEVVGQARAVHTITRSLTVSLAGLAEAEAPLGIYLFLGPSGTGKTHTARALARLLHGDTRRLAVVDCKQVLAGDEAVAVARQLAPHFHCSVEAEEGVRAMPPRSIVLIEHIESATRPFVHALLGQLEAGVVTLPDGHGGSLRGCLVLMTSNLCAREIYGDDRKEIGFSPISSDLEESEKARIYQVCATAAEKTWGSVLLGHIDDLIIFHRLRDPHLPLILERQLDQLNRTLGGRFRVELQRGALEFLLERGKRWPQHGAWFLVKVFRRFVVFPVADLVASGTRSGDGRIVVSRDGERLCFTVRGASTRSPHPASSSIPVS